MDEPNDAWWLLRSGVSPQAYMLHGVLLTAAQDPDGEAPTTSELANLLGFRSRQMASRYIRELTDLGVLDVTKMASIRRANVYSVRRRPDGPSLPLSPRLGEVMVRAMSPLEALRAEFARCPARRVLRQEIDEGLHCCAECFAVDDLEVDHVKALDAGGVNEAWNYQVLCGRCNGSKGNREPAA